ncbi:GDSL-type esterase/lipase family protein [Thalassoroseus pseudoceratinae]|uniref:GDSL-type esterase/lipase family protein n=1 Tax=Thalassoroseus pseudoceratinae TaxID=2713176 RepID=UPI001420893E|nr:GDSL-type esterase/lipase family protein [Thalassoroseus pseudoceratinae]
MLRLPIYWMCLFFLPAQLATAAEPHVELQDGDRVVFLGGTLVEREQRFGYWETALTLLNADRDLTFRNLGWSGDTVWAESRGIFDSPAVGYRRLIEQVRELQPNVFFLQYGNNEALKGVAELPKFLKQYGKLLDDLQAATEANARFVLLSPTLQTPVIAPEKVVEHNNRLIAAYAKGIQAMAVDRGVSYISALNLLSRYQNVDGANRATDDGVIPNRDGFRLSAKTIFGEVKTSAEHEPLRQAIVLKNRYYFQQWRPQNITYLTGFRKHEQGQNAAELAEFNALIAKQEQRIRELKSPH